MIRLRTYLYRDLLLNTAQQLDWETLLCGAVGQILGLKIGRESVRTVHPTIDDNPEVAGEPCDIIVVITAPDQQGVDPEEVAAYVAENLNGFLRERGKHYVSLRVTAEFVRSSSARCN